MNKFKFIHWRLAFGFGDRSSYMVLRFFFLGLAFLFMFCADFERDSPNDPDGKNYRGSVLPSSSSVKSSSSSMVSSSSAVVPSSSSVVPSSSSNVVSSSSVAVPSSSSSTVSSSSVKNSSSSMVSSSSAVVPSSSSVAPSSSSNVVSSSSVAVPSSSSNLCVDFVNGTTREHYGMKKEQFCDERDGKKYVYVKIGEQTWMAENLNCNVSGSKCYSNNESYCDTYGRLYNWATAMALPSSCNSSSCSSQINAKHQGICPSGWHIPSDAEWKALTGPWTSNTDIVGRYLKTRSGWNGGGNGKDNYGFSALPGGTGRPFGDFENVRSYGYWWSASEYDAGKANYLYTFYTDYVYFKDFGKSELLSVRCLRN